MLLKVVITGRLLLWIGEKRDKSETAWKVRIIIKRAWHLYRNVLHLKVLIISSSKLSVFLFSVQFSHSVKSDSLWPHGLQHARLPCPSPTPRAFPNPYPSSQGCHPTISSSVDPSPPTFNLIQHQSLFQWVSSSNQVDKVLEFQLQHQSFQWIFRTDLH